MSEKYPDGKTLRSVVALCNRQIRDGKQERTFRAVRTVVEEVQMLREIVAELEARLGRLEDR